MKKFELWTCIDDQACVGFTGKINILELNGKIAGEIVLFEGNIISTQFNSQHGFKALFLAFVSEIEMVKHRYLVEPEIITGVVKNIHYPVNILKKKLEESISIYLETKNKKPPKNVKLLLNPEFITKGEAVTSAEFEVMCIISDYNIGEDIYRESKLLDFEVTQALVSLRRKKGIKVLNLNT